MIIHFANGYVLSRDFGDGRARIRTTELGRRAGPDIRDEVFAAMALATCERFGDTSKPILVPVTGPDDDEGGVWLTEPQAYAVLTTPGGNPRGADILLRGVIQAFVDLRDGRVTSALREPVTPTFSPTQSGGSFDLSEFDALYTLCLAPQAELPPNKLRSAVISGAVEIFDARRVRARRGTTATQLRGQPS